MARKNKQDQFAEREAQKYEYPIASREYILDLLSEKNRPLSFRQFLDELDIQTENQTEALRRRLLAMVRDGQLHQNRRGAYGLISKMELIPGYVIGHKDGFGFVVPENGNGDLFLSARQMRSVFHGDKVLARVSGLDYRGRKEAIVVEVVERNTHHLVGRFINESGVSFLQPSNTRIPNDILIPSDQTLGAKHGQMVVIELTVQPSATQRPLGKVTEIIGDHMAPGMEIDVAIRNHDLPTEWPDEVLREAKRYATIVSDEEIRGRLDLRELPFVTIDGEDAKDFDDAVYCEPLPKGGWKLYVAIADVSHYVKPNQALDAEALKRGNSVYFPGRVIPMLPEVLSNELCSLNSHVDRLTMTCEMKINTAGKIDHYRFHESVIRSHARLTYNEVHAAIEKEDTQVQNRYTELMPHLYELYKVFFVLQKARMQRGAIEFDLPETKIIFGEGRKIERIVPSVRFNSHRVIEECMLCANISAAKFLIKNEFPGLYRVHEGPSAEKLTDLRKFLGEIGLKLPGGEKPTPQDYASLLKTIEERPDAHVIQSVLLRSLSQAVYTHENKGHFGLAYDAYTHFTSPIRRYPDLLVHRAIRKILRREANEADAKLVNMGEHCSMTERRADEATREAMDWLKCEYMLDKVGEDFVGVISSVTNFGVFVELKDIYVEGLVHISMLQSDYYHFDPIKHALIGEHSGDSYRLGDVVKVRVVRVDLDQRRIDFMMTEDILDTDEMKPHRRKKNKKKSKKKSKPQDGHETNMKKKRKRHKDAP